MKTFDVIVIGGGSAGIAAVEGATAAGAKNICVVEVEKALGGECVAWACVPTKSMLRAAKMYHDCKYESGRYGVTTGRVNFDFSTMLRRRDGVIKTLTDNGQRLSSYLKSLHVTVKHGPAHFINDKTIDVKGERLKAHAFVIATGSRERLPVVDGLDTVKVHHSHDLVKLKRLPSSVTILGAGPVGSEFATFFGLLGIKTTLIEFGPHILPKEDLEIATLAESSLRHTGVAVLTSTRALGVKPERGGIRLTYQVGRKPRQTLWTECLVTAVGRQANVVGLGLDKTKVNLDAHGNLILSSSLRTSVKHIFAAGDAAAGLQFTHIAHHEGYLAGWNAATSKKGGELGTREERVVPRVTFLNPEVASVGLTPVAATKAKKKFKLVTFPFSALGRAAIDGQRDGLLKIVVEQKTGQILGAHLTGQRAGEIVHELALAMYAGIPLRTVQSMLHAYPSWSEVIPAAAD